MGRSFVFGICVASVTWGISLYLYWVLTGSTEVRYAVPSDAERMVDNSHKLLTHSNSENDLLYDNPQLISIKRLDDDTYKRKQASKDKFLDKMRRYKKEQKHRRISQHLVDELQPHQVEINGKRYTWTW